VQPITNDKDLGSTPIAPPAATFSGRVSIVRSISRNAFGVIGVEDNEFTGRGHLLANAGSDCIVYFSQSLEEQLLA
jgi:hypothetical protein